MSAFEFSFTFYGLVLGLSVVELVAGIGRLVHEGHRVRVGWMTPLLAAFLTLDIATFWNQAWVMNQKAPYSITLLILGVVSAGLFYIAASLAFPREIEDGQDLTEHYWRHRRLALSLVGAANLINMSLSAALAEAQAPGQFWSQIGFLAVLSAVIAGSAFLPRGRAAIACLVLILANDMMFVAVDAFALIRNGPWEQVSAWPGGAPIF